MPTQRLLLVAIAGKAGHAVTSLFHHWRDAKQGTVWPEHIRQAVDAFCIALRENVSDLSLVYHCEWVDRWLMGDDLSVGTVIEGRRFHVCCATVEEVAAWIDRMSEQHQEQYWLRARLREAMAAWRTHTAAVSFVMVREVLGPLATDEEVTAALQQLPAWLAHPR